MSSARNCYGFTLKAGFLFMAWALFCVATPIHAQETLRAITAFPKSSTFSQSFKGFVDLVNKRGKGVIHIDYVGGPEVVPPKKQAGAVRRGIVDMQYGPATYNLGVMPEVNAWVGATVTSATARSNGGFELMQKIYKQRLGVKLLAHLDSQLHFHIYTVNKPPRTSGGEVTFKGLRLRAQPIYQAFFKSLGAIPVSVPVSNVYNGLERNIFDGVGWPLIGIGDFSWDKFLGYRVDPGFLQGDLAVIINPRKWQGLSDKAKQVITRTAVDYEKISDQNLQSMRRKIDSQERKKGMKVIKLKGRAATRFLDKAYQSVWSDLKNSDSKYYSELRQKYYTR